MPESDKQQAKPEAGPKGSFDPKKPVQTRDGRKVRIVCTDFVTNDGRSIIALIQEKYGEMMCLYDQSGIHRGNAQYDLVNVKQKKWKWAYTLLQGVLITAYHYSEEEIKNSEFYIRGDIVGRIMETEIEEE